MTALESKTSDAYSNEDEVTQRKLKFLMFMVELAAKDPEWKENLKDKAEAFRRLEI
jgi:hypothetical protein